MNDYQYTPVKTSDEAERLVDLEDKTKNSPPPKENEPDFGRPIFLGVSMFGLLLWLAYVMGTLTSCLRIGRYNEFARFVPFTKQPVIFNEDKRWAHSSPEADALWEELGANGFARSVVIQDPRKYHLKPGIDSLNGTERFGLSMYHQLHCLSSIRASFYSAPSHTRRERTRLISRNEHIHPQHIDHCFDYLRQAIECSADLTIEWARPNGGNQIDGWGVPHYQCKDPESIEDFIHENQLI